MIIERQYSTGMYTGAAECNTGGGKGYRPGYVNVVYLVDRGSDVRWFYGDGYKTQFGGYARNRIEALGAMGMAITYGAGGGFTSPFKGYVHE